MAGSKCGTPQLAFDPRAESGNPASGAEALLSVVLYGGAEAPPFRIRQLQSASHWHRSEFYVCGCGRMWLRPLWIEEVREKFDAVGQARPGAGEVTVGVHREDAASANGWEILPALGNFRGLEFGGVAFCVVAAEHYYDHVGVALRDVVC